MIGRWLERNCVPGANKSQQTGKANLSGLIVAVGGGTIAEVSTALRELLISSR
jgi:hypothetical protein